MAINLQPPPLPPQKTPVITSYIIRCVCQFEVSPRSRLNTALLVDILRVFFFVVALSKAFRKASLSLTKEQVSRSAKSATSSRVSSHLGTRMKD